MKTFLFLLLSVFPVSASASWELNEVSFLFPLPGPAQANRLWDVRTNGVGGALLPRSIYDKLPMLVVWRDREWIYPNLRVVGVRVDPCFQEGTSPCRKQVRLAWQPMEELRGQWTTLDAAVHTFHDLDDASWTRLRDGLTALKTRFPMPPNLPLQVHPHLASSGPNGAYWQSFSRLILGVIGFGNLSRATVMTVNTEGTVWVFTGFDIKNGEATRIPVARTNHVAQAFFFEPGDPLEYRSSMNPFPANEAPFLNLLSDSAKAEREMGEEEIAKAVRSSLVALNPRRSNPGTIDCASCHAARAVPDWAAEKFPRWNWETMFGDDLFRGAGNLANTTVQPRRTNLLRAFGYFGTEPVISPRTVFESSLVAGAMDNLLLK